MEWRRVAHEEAREEKPLVYSTRPRKRSRNAAAANGSTMVRKLQISNYFFGCGCLTVLKIGTYTGSWLTSIGRQPCWRSRPSQHFSTNLRLHSRTYARCMSPC